MFCKCFILYVTTVLNREPNDSGCDKDRVMLNEDVTHFTARHQHLDKLIT